MWLLRPVATFFGMRTYHSYGDGLHGRCMQFPIACKRPTSSGCGRRHHGIVALLPDVSAANVAVGLGRSVRTTQAAHPSASTFVIGYCRFLSIQAVSRRRRLEPDVVNRQRFEKSVPKRD
jgi:hypothetical protein